MSFESNLEWAMTAKNEKLMHTQCTILLSRLSLSKMLLQNVFNEELSEGTNRKMMSFNVQQQMSRHISECLQGCSIIDETMSVWESDGNTEA